MLQVIVESTDFYDEDNNTFIKTPKILLRLEHSLVSISKWETIWRKPFLDPYNDKTAEESISYIKCMTLNQNVDPMVYYALTSDNIEKINEYIATEHTATTFRDIGRPPSRELVTSELIYYQMNAYNIPMECQKWPLSRLLTLIRIHQIKSSDGKKMPKHEILRRNKELNAARRKAMRSRG